jgi:hypothetical protein
MIEKKRRRFGPFNERGSGSHLSLTQRLMAARWMVNDGVRQADTSLPN